MFYTKNYEFPKAKWFFRHVIWSKSLTHTPSDFFFWGGEKGGGLLNSTLLFSLNTEHKQGCVHKIQYH